MDREKLWAQFVCVYCCLFVDSTNHDAAFEQPAGMKDNFHINPFLQLSTRVSDLVISALSFVSNARTFMEIVFPHSCLCIKSNLKEIKILKCTFSFFLMNPICSELFKTCYLSESHEGMKLMHNSMG